MTSSKLTLFILMAALLASPVAAQKVYVDFDETVDFSQYKTFAFRESSEDLRDSNQLGHTRVQNAIRRQMMTGDQPGRPTPADGAAAYRSRTSEPVSLGRVGAGADFSARRLRGAGRGTGAPRARIRRVGANFYRCAPSSGSGRDNRATWAKALRKTRGQLPVW